MLRNKMCIAGYLLTTYPSFYLIKENKRLDQDLFVCRVKSVVATIIILSKHDIKIIVGHAKPNRYDDY